VKEASMMPNDSAFPPLARLSLNQMTTPRWSLREAADGCARAGLGWIGVWRDKLADAGVEAGAKLIRDAGLRVSGLCRGGMFPAATAAERAERIEDNRRAIAEAAAIGTSVLVLVCGAAPDKDIDAAREQIAAGIATVADEAKAAGVVLAIEPLHPAFAATRSAITTLGEALDIADEIDHPHVQVVIDVYHLWWDPQLYAQIARAAGRIAAYHVNDWLTTGGDPLTTRGMMGDGVIELRRIRHAVEAAGYHDGPIEVEIFNPTYWEMPGDDVLALMKDRYRAHV
jgi:sugar phosphate isomerase/epimerase